MGIVVASAYAQNIQPDSHAKTLLERLIEWATSPEATAVGWISGIIGLVLTIISMLLYFQEKRSNRALDQIVSQFQIGKELEQQVARTESEKEQIQAQAAKLTEEVRKFEADIRERLPIEAKVAFLRNAIPALEEQIFALVAQRNQMILSLQEMGDVSLHSEEATKIISAESQVRLSAKRQLETYQTQLSIVTVTISVFLYIVPYPADRIILFLLSFVLIAILVNMARMFRYVYPEAFLSRTIQRATKSKSSIVITVLSLALILSILAFAAIVLTRMVWFRR